MNRRDINRIGEYVALRLSRMRECQANIEQQVESTSQSFIEECDDRQACSEYLRRMDVAVLYTFRSSMLVATCALVEEALKLICSSALPNYREPTGHVIGTLERMLERDLKVDTTSEVEAEAWGAIDDLVAIRNCIVHAGGKIDGCRDGAKNRIEKLLAKQANVGEANRVFEKSTDGYLIPSDNAVPSMLCHAECVAKQVMRHLAASAEVLGLASDAASDVPST